MKKAVKIISLLLVVIMTLSVFLTMVFADSQPPAFSFSVSYGEATIYGYSGTESELVIPKQVKNPNSETYYNVTEICFSDFASGVEYSSISIPETIKKITFEQDILCGSYIINTDNEENDVYKTVDGVLYNKDMAKLVRYPCRNTRKSFTVPADVIMIAPQAFKSSVYLEKVVFGGIVRRIGVEAFSGCINLKTIDNLPVGYSSVGENAFEGCESLLSATALVLSNFDCYSNVEDYEEDYHYYADDDETLGGFGNVLSGILNLIFRRKK